MKNMRKLAGIIALVMVIQFIATACKTDEELTEYSVTFNVNGGSNVPNQIKVNGERVEKPSDPTKGTYSFGGWYKESDLTNLWDFDIDMVNGNVTLYARWNSTVTFHPNGATSGTAPATQSEISEGEPITLPDQGNLLRYAFNFFGWNTLANGTGTNYSSTYTPTGNITLYARWTDKPIRTVNFNVNGGTSISNENVIDGELVTKPTDPTKTGADFGGWYKESTFINEWDFNTDTVTVTPTNIYAKWNVTVTFINFKGAPVVPATATITQNDKVSEPDADPPDEWYESPLGTLEGWFTENTFVNEWDFLNDPVDKHIILYAKWTTTKEWEVTLDPVYGVVVGTGEEKTKIYIIHDTPIGNDMPEYVDLSRPTYSITDWYTNALYLGAPWNVDEALVSSEGLYLRAKWEPNSSAIQHVVTFTPNYPIAPNISPFAESYGDNAYIPWVNGFTNLEGTPTTKRDNWFFKGWSKTFIPTTHPTPPAAENLWDFDTDKVTSNMALFGYWLPIYVETITPILTTDPKNDPYTLVPDSILLPTEWFLTLDEGDEAILGAVITPWYSPAPDGRNPLNPSVTWATPTVTPPIASVENTGTAPITTETNTGEILARNVGTAVITGSANRRDGEPLKEAKVTITVRKKQTFNISFEQIKDLAPEITNSAAGEPLVVYNKALVPIPGTSPVEYYPSSLGLTFNDTSITGSPTWTVTGTSPPVTFTATSITLDGTSPDYNRVGHHFITLEVTKDGLKYSKTITFEVKAIPVTP